MSDDNPGRWDLRMLSVDRLVTDTKLQGCASSIQGWTTPEGWPFVVVVAIAKPDSEVALELALEFHEQLTQAGVPVLSINLNPNRKPPG